MKANWFLVSLISLFFVGCAAPRVVQTVPVHVMTNAPAAKPAYEYGHAPSQRLYADDGPEFKRHRRLEQEARLEHERHMKELEYHAQEQEFAKRRGVVESAPAQTAQVQQPVVLQTTPCPGPAVFSYQNNDYYGYNGSYGYPIQGSGSFTYSGAGAYGYVRGGWLGRMDNWIGNKITGGGWGYHHRPSYYQPGGVIVREYGGSANIYGTGCFNSGFSFGYHQ